MYVSYHSIDEYLQATQTNMIDIFYGIV